MAVAWALGVWANDSWVGMNGGPPNAWRGASTPVFTGNIASGSQGVDQKPSGKKRPRVIRWSDFASQEERAAELALAIAETGVPIRAPSESFDEFEDDDEALMAAILLAKVIH